jgi:chemotaxis protein CheX
MPTTQNIAESLIRENITRAVSDVFKTMLGHAVQLRAPADPASPQMDHMTGMQQVVGTVGFIGDANGLIYLYLEEDFANQCTSEMLGLTPQELLETGADAVNDAIGELTNMVVGSFKNGLCDAGYPCKLTIPSILRGSNFSVEPISSAQRHVYSFDCCGRRIAADILLKFED